MKAKYILLLLLLVFANYSLRSQDSSFSKDRLIDNLNQYRDSVLEKNEDADLSFSQVLERWKELEPNRAKLSYTLNNLQYARTIRKLDFADLKNVAIRKTDNSELSRSFTLKELNVFTNNIVFFLLISTGVFDYDYPHAVNESKIFDEIEFYGFESKDIIADIGAGQGIFSLLLSFSNGEQKIYVNEINQRLLSFIDEEIVRIAQKPSNLITIGGDKTSISLPEKVDRIILRNTFHHFKKTRKMMKSIKEQLKPDGIIVVKEGLKINAVKECKRKMLEEELKSKFAKHHFELLDEMKIENTIYMKYKVSMDKQ